MDEFKAFNENLIAEFRANNGAVTGMFAGAPLLLLTTTGAKSGQPRVSPVVYTRDGDRWVIIASKGGAPTHPDWYHNLRANPKIDVEVGAETFPVTVEDIVGDERDRLWTEIVAERPGFGDYQTKTTRTIPVLRLTRTG